MSIFVLTVALFISKVFLTLAVATAAYRILRGPRAQDRVLGMDTLYVNAMLLLLVFGIGSGTTLYFEVALVIGLLGFVATLTLAKFLLRGEVIE